MLKVDPIARLAPPSKGRTASLMALGFLGSIVSMAFSPAASAMSSEGADLQVLHIFLSIPFLVLAPLALGWRHKRPVLVAVGTAALSLLVPIGNTVPFIALSALIGRRRGSAVAAASILTLASSAVIVIIDSLQQPRINSLIKTTFTQGAEEEYINVSPFTVAATILIGWGLSIAVGLVIRNNRLRVASEKKATWVQQESEHLHDDLARQAERELIAREIHDGLGHRLSILNLHAGAMEAQSEANPELQDSARLVRETAAGAMDDLRALLDILHPDGATQPTVALRDLQRVVGESVGTDQALASSIFIEEADAAHPRLANAVYRIVQELLTNARKHAPGQRIQLSVNGGPNDGVTIEATNELGHQGSPPSRKSAGRGLTGIAERVRLLRGTLEHGVVGGKFRVHVHLPWMLR